MNVINVVKCPFKLAENIELMNYQQQLHTDLMIS